PCLRGSTASGTVRAGLSSNAPDADAFKSSSIKRAPWVKAPVKERDTQRLSFENGRGESRADVAAGEGFLPPAHSGGRSDCSRECRAGSLRTREALRRIRRGTEARRRRVIRPTENRCPRH